METQKEQRPAGSSRTTCCVSLLIESALSADDVKKIHSFGECWIANYDPTRREYWEKALWIYAWEKKVVWQEPRINVPTGHSPHNASI